MAVQNHIMQSTVSRVLNEIKYIITAISRNRHELIWSKVLYYGVFLQLGLVYGLWVWFTKAKWMTLLLVYPFGMMCGLGATAGTHRLWSHKSYKANLPLRIILMVLQSMCKQHSIYEWAVDHRLHHKYSDTEGDPHNASRGYFFTHLGWLMVRKNEVVLAKMEKIDIRDLEEDGVVMFQKKYFELWTIFWCYVVPPLIPWYFWNEDPWISLVVMGLARQSLILHWALMVNSFAHSVGNRPYDKNIRPTDNAIICMLAIGEGWHNFHHVFPWDYRSAELGNSKYNLTTGFINLMAKIGWANDLKVTSMDLVRRRSKATGDGTRQEYDEKNVWGWGDKDMDVKEKELIKEFNKLKS